MAYMPAILLSKEWHSRRLLAVADTGLGAVVSGTGLGLCFDTAKGCV